MAATDMVFTSTVHSLVDDALRVEAYLPSSCVQSHAANLLPLPNGDILCVWFAGTQEGIADISIYSSRLAKGNDTWSEAVKLSDDPTCSEQNPVLFSAPSGELWLMWTAQKSGNQDTAIIRKRISQDNGQTWGPIEILFDTPGTFVRQPIVVLPSGEWLLPIFYCRANPGEKWVGNNDCSAVKISRDQGKTWEEVLVPGSIGCVHMNIVPLANGKLAAFYRSRWADFVYRSESFDNGRTWSEPVPTPLPNNNSSIQVATLKNGRLAMVFNNMSAAGTKERRTSLYDDIEDDDPASQAPSAAAPDGRTAFWGAPRAPMSLAISEDGGKTWPHIRDVEVGDGYCLTNNSKEKINREFSYPSIKQTEDGMLHIAFTYFRQRIKYVRVPEEWITEEK